MDIKKNLYLNGVCNLIVLGVFFILIGQQTVVTQLVFSIVPVFVSIAVTATANSGVDMEKDNLKAGALLCALLVFAVLIVEYVGIQIAGVNDLEAFSQQVSSEYVTVSKNSNPVFSMFIFSLGTFVVDYNILKHKGNERVNGCLKMENE